ncbi:MAG TPA: nucleoside recognition domain-containing protein [Bacteroidota bacterium]|nr:nucleoside recognition domain-containing protein [Bacteroidota bacterium]
MLNQVWISLIVIGLLVAVGKDINDEARNTYRNGVPMTATLHVEEMPTAFRETWQGELIIPRETFDQFYGVQSAPSEFHQPITLTTNSSGKTSLILAVNDSTPAFWKEMATNSGDNKKLLGSVVSLHFSEDKSTAQISFVLAKLSYVKLRAVTRAALDYADSAVTISLGLIGVMALWLGVMKVAEEAGLLKVLTKLLTPITSRLFPDVPPDHPAIGAMIMNIAANMLGLNNAATPLGLKAMEELNKLNPKIGTATNAMCTFLVINTAGLTLVPATAIAIRAAEGSSDPGIIIGTSIFGAGCATIAGLVSVKLLERLPRYKKDLLPEPSSSGANNG